MEPIVEPEGHALRRERLVAELARMPSAAVAFSGGVDSSVLLHAAHAVLGFDRVVGVIADSPSLARSELEEARAVGRAIGARIVELSTDELDDPRYRENRGDRCYFCKSALFAAMEPWARAHGYAALCFGEIADDLLEVRPGRKAASEFGVHAPLAAAGFTKADVRWYAKEVGLAVADKPSSPCLASRLPVGTVVTRERLSRIERSERALSDLGLRELRVRDHGDRARVEIGRGEMDRARALAERIDALLAVEGFASVELAVYRSPAERIGPPAGP